MLFLGSVACNWSLILGRSLRFALDFTSSVVSPERESSVDSDSESGDEDLSLEVDSFIDALPDSPVFPSWCAASSSESSE